MANRSHRSIVMGGLALSLAFAPAVARASAEKAAPAAEAKKAEAKPAEVKPTETKKVEEKAADGKRIEVKPGEAKKVDAKPGDAKPGDTKDKDGKPAADKPAEGDESAEKAKPKPKKKPSAAKEPAKIPGEGPSPASPPPLTIGGLRDEIRRESAGSKIDPGASPRTKVEQMLTEIVKTREALHAETLKLEGMMAQEPADGAPGAPGAAGGAAGGKPAAKNPLDILAKALRGIKPEQAAPIVSRLDKRLAATVLQRMPPVDAGKIMGAMKPDAAAELATQIAMRVPEGKK